MLFARVSRSVFGVYIYIGTVHLDTCLGAFDWVEREEWCEVDLHADVDAFPS
jgi:hypothetical protein